MYPVKTIFITSFQGLVSRVLEGGVLKSLLSSGNVRIVILVLDFKTDYFRRVFGKYNNVFIEGVSGTILSRRARFLHKLTFLLLHTRTMRLKRRSARDFKSWPRYFLHQGVASSLGRWRIVRVLFRGVSRFFSGGSVLDKYFEKYRPDLVVAMDIKDILDTQFVLEAHARGVRTVGMVRSWDYLTAKGVIRVKPQKMVVHNETIKDEAVRYADMRPKDVIVVGIPHFDLYVNRERTSRQEFFKKIGITPDKRLLFFGSVGKKFGATDHQIFEMLDRAIHQGELPGNLVVLVRLPPTDVLAREVRCCSEHFVFEYPGVSFAGRDRKENEMGLEDLMHLADSIFHSDAVITGPSTICIDAAVFDKPIICLGFEGHDERPYFESIIHRYDFDHMQNFVRCNASWIARSEKELLSFIRRALEKPQELSGGRNRLVKEQCWKLDGRASERLAQFLISFANQKSAR